MIHVLSHRRIRSAGRGVRQELWVIVLDVEGLPLLLAKSLRVTRAVDNRAEQVKALTTLGLATPVLAEGRTATILTGVLVSIVLANSFATTLLASVLPLPMRADRGATTLNTTFAPLQMHTLDSGHPVSHAGTQGNGD